MVKHRGNKSIKRKRREEKLLSTQLEKKKDRHKRSSAKNGPLANSWQEVEG